MITIYKNFEWKYYKKTPATEETEEVITEITEEEFSELKAAGNLSVYRKRMQVHYYKNMKDEFIQPVLTENVSIWNSDPSDWEHPYGDKFAATFGWRNFADKDSYFSEWQSNNAYSGEYAFCATNPSPYNRYHPLNKTAALVYYVPEGIYLTGFMMNCIPTLAGEADCCLKTFEIWAGNDLYNHRKWVKLGSFENNVREKWINLRFELKTETKYKFFILNPLTTYNSTSRHLMVFHWRLLGYYNKNIVEVTEQEYLNRPTESTDYYKIDDVWYEEITKTEYDTLEDKTNTLINSFPLTEDEYSATLEEAKPSYYTFIRNNKMYGVQHKFKTALNFVPWTMPTLKENGLMFDIGEDNNYSVWASAEEGSAPAWHGFGNFHMDGSYYCSPKQVNNKDYQTLIFHSPVPLLLKGLSIEHTNVTKIELFGSYDGVNMGYIGEWTPLRDGMATGYVPISRPKYRFHGLHSYSVNINPDLQKTYKYIILKLYGIRDRQYLEHIYVKGLIFDCDQLSNTDYTDRALEEWEQPKLTDSLTAIDNQNVVCYASSLRGSKVAPMEDKAGERYTFCKNYNLETRYNHCSWAPSEIEYNEETHTGTGFWCVVFPYKIAITKLIHTNPYYAGTRVDWSDDTHADVNIVGQYFADEAMTVPLGEAFTCNGSETVHVAFESSNPVITNRIFFRKISGGKFGGIGDLKIEAKKCTLTKVDEANAKLVVSNQGLLPANKQSSSFDWFSLLVQILVLALSIYAAAATGGSSLAVGGAILSGSAATGSSSALRGQ